MKNILSFLFIFLMINQVNAQTQRDSTLKEVAASFEGGGANLKRLLHKNFKLPSSLANSDYQGVFVISFIVEKDGTMTIDYLNYDNMFFKRKKKVNETIINQVKEDLFTETKRVFSQLPNWTPGVQEGKPVRSKFSMPFTIEIM